MKHLDQSSFDLVLNRSIFEDIHQIKAYFIQLFSEVANEISNKDLLGIHPFSQGIKISKGNELQNCPYQVLDIIRDFDKEQGFNIRILNWWGRGLFIFIFLGKNNEKIFRDIHQFSELQSQGFLLAQTLSPWDYKNIIDGGKMVKTSGQETQFTAHLNQFHHLQWVKKIDYPKDCPALTLMLIGQVLQILNLYRE